MPSSGSHVRGEAASDVELKTTLAVGTKGTQARKRSALSAANALQDVVQNAIELIGSRGRGDVGLLCQPSR
jgi:hypothetical protein